MKKSKRLRSKDLTFCIYANFLNENIDRKKIVSWMIEYDGLHLKHNTINSFGTVSLLLSNSFNIFSLLFPSYYYPTVVEGNY